MSDYNSSSFVHYLETSGVGSFKFLSSDLKYNCFFIFYLIGDYFNLIIWIYLFRIFNQYCVLITASSYHYMLNIWLQYVCISHLVLAGRVQHQSPRVDSSGHIVHLHLL